ncbi:MAG: hypothetical protein J6X69_04070 [Bacteroidales bacterium]|nr:hypothetical protein [Bacteroidales bacterium]
MIERRIHRFSRSSDAGAEQSVSRRTPQEPTIENGGGKGPEDPAGDDAPYGGGGNGGARTVMVILIGVVVVLIGVLAYIWVSKQKLVNELDEEKQELTQKMLELQNDYKDLSSDYASINAQLDSSREEVNQLIERIQKTEATNRAAIRRYEKELGTLRSIMKSYIVQIDSLNTANKKLKADVASARRDLSESQKKNEELTQTVGDLSDKVAAGSVIKARGIYMEGQRKNGKKTDRARDVVTLATHLSLIENDLAPKGPMMVYVLVWDAEGNLLVNPEQPVSMMSGEEEVPVSAGREVDYNGSEVDIVLYLKNMGKLNKGVYTVDIYTDHHKLGGTELMLR